MAISYFSGVINGNMSYLVNKYNIHKFDEDNILITLDYGPWILLDKREFDLLRRNQVANDINLYKRLEEKGIIINSRNFSKAAEECKNKLSYITKGIDLGIITPTLRCNQNCLYCHANAVGIKERGYDMDRETAKAAVDFLFQTPSENITIEFQGGEPLVNFEAIQFIIEYAKKKNQSDNPDANGQYAGKKLLWFMLVSNMTLMDKDIADFLMKNKVLVCTSLDGPKELHDKNRPYIGGGGAYEDVIRWVNYFSIEKKYKFFRGMIPTITRFSLDYPEEIVDEYIAHGMNHTRARPLNIAGRTIENWDKIGYNSEEFMIFWHKYFDYVIEKGRSSPYFWDDDVRALMMKMTYNDNFRHACMNKPCGIGTIQCAVNHKGDVYACDEARSNEMFKIGNVKEDTYQKVFTSKAVADMIGLSSCTATLCDSCAWNAYCAVCIVNIYGSQKNMIPKMPMDQFCKIRGEQVRCVFEKLIFSKDRSILLEYPWNFRNT